MKKNIVFFIYLYLLFYKYYQQFHANLITQWEKRETTKYFNINNDIISELKEVVNISNINTNICLTLCAIIFLVNKLISKLTYILKSFLQIIKILFEEIDIQWYPTMEF
jgi:hypothetical protein